jgi:hypothetical protein
VQASDAERAREPQEQRDDAEMFTVQQLRAMEQPSWNEGRLDDLNKRVDDGFKRMDVGFERMDERFEKTDKRFEKINEEFKAVRSEMKADFDRMHRTLFLGAAGIIAALITSPHL